MVNIGPRAIVYGYVGYAGSATVSISASPTVTFTSGAVTTTPRSRVPANRGGLLYRVTAQVGL